MNWIMFGAIALMIVVLSGVADRILSTLRAIEAHARHLANRADEAADTLQRIETELGMARHDRNDTRRS